MHNLHVPLFSYEKAVPAPRWVVCDVRVTAGPPMPYRRNQMVTLNQRTNMNPIRVCILDTSVKHKAKECLYTCIHTHIHTYTHHLSIQTTKRSPRNKTLRTMVPTQYSLAIPKKILSWGNQAKYTVLCAALLQKGINCHLFKTFSQLR